MDGKQIKNALKAAREAIRNKEFKEALRQCKVILAEDKENYMSLVLVAVAAEGLEQFDQALKAYKRAIDADESQLLAWQGLSSFYEKQGCIEHIPDRLNVYLKLIQLYKGDSEKSHDCLIKVTKLVDKRTEPELVEKIVRLCTDAEKSETVTERRKDLQLMLINVLQFQNQPECKEKIQMLCKDIIDGTTDYSEAMESIISQYLTGVSESLPVSEIKNVYTAVYEKFPNSFAALEHVILCKLDGFCVALGSEGSQLPENFEELVNLYESKTSEGEVLMCSKGYIGICRRDFLTTRKLLTEATNQSTDLLCTYVFLAWSSLQLHQNEAALTACQQGLAVLNKKTRRLTIQSGNVTAVFHHIQAQALYAIGDKMSLEKALEIIQTELDLKDKRINVLKGLVHLKTKDLEKAKTCLVDAPPLSCLLEGLICEEEEKYPQALLCFQKAVEMEPLNASYLLHLAKCQFKMEGHRQESFGNLLKAAKQDPYHADIFLYLGHYYHREVMDMTRARKCYQKSYDLDPNNDETGEVLCDLLNKEGEEEQANKILTSVTSKANAGCAKWAWLRLGLYQVKHEDPSIAIASLQAALRADPSDTHVWECLGEAYYARGSYTAALKAFNRASELNPDSMYCLFQMASIKQELAMYTEAVEEYKHILEISPNYVPALKGLGETYIFIGRSYLTKFLHGRSMEKCEAALAVLLRAASMRPDLSCLWKLAGDSCTILNVLPVKMFRFEKSDKTCMDKLETLQYGGRCYIRAVKILPECSSLWHDLGMNYFHQSKCSTGETGSQLIEKAVQALKKAIELEPANHRHWTALGFIAASKGYYRPGLAQHCFIKSIQAEHNNAVAWTNLASLYLKHENVKLAHEAFKIAQRLEPSYVSCWIGQAIIAEIVGHEDAMDLFRHTTDLGNHLEGALGYSHWVCTMLQSRDTHESYIYQYAIEQMAAVPASIDALARYTDRVKTNPVAYNMYGLLLEKQKLFKTAAVQFKCAIELLSGNGGDILKEVTCNYARVLCACGDYEGSCQIYESMDDLENFVDVCQSALAFYKCGKLEQSFQAYNKAAELAPSEGDRSHVLAAVAMVIYKFGNMDSAKTKLFESAQMGQPSVNGLKALCALGLKQSDATLAMAALQELYKLDETIANIHRQDVSLLGVLVDHLQDNVIEGLRRIQKQLMMSPGDHKLWHLLSTVLTRYFPERGMAITNSAKTAHLLEEPRKQRCFGLMCGGQLSAGLHCMKDINNNALLSAQRAVYLYPGEIENWACLAAALHAEAVLTTDLQRRQTLLEQELSLLSSILNRENLSLGLKLWCHKQRTVCSIHANKHSEVLSSLESMLDDFGSEKHAQQFFEVFQSVMKGDIDNMSMLAQAADLPYFWEILIEMYLKNGLMQEAESLVQQSISSTSSRKSLLIRLANALYLKAVESGKESERGQFDAVANQVLSLDRNCSPVFLMQGVLNLTNNIRQSRYQMQDVYRQEVDGHVTGSRKFGLSVARRALIYILKSTKKDPETLESLISEAENEGDMETLQYIQESGN